MSIFEFLYNASKRVSRKGINDGLRNVLENVGAGSRILNVGSGGAVEEQLRQLIDGRDIDCVSMDIDPKRSPDIVGDICVLDAAGAYDIVVFCEVLEHIPTPHLAIDNIHRCLKADGLLVMSVPFIYPIHDRPADYFRFTRYGLEYLLRNFKIELLKERNSWLESVIVLMTRLITVSRGMRIFSAMFVLVSLALYPVAVLVSKFYRNDFLTTGYIVVARK